MNIAAVSHRSFNCCESSSRWLKKTSVDTEFLGETLERWRIRSIADDVDTELSPRNCAGVRGFLSRGLNVPVSMACGLIWVHACGAATDAITRLL